MNCHATLIGSCIRAFFVVFFFNDTATTEIYTLSLHDALPISCWIGSAWPPNSSVVARGSSTGPLPTAAGCASIAAGAGGPAETAPPQEPAGPKGTYAGTRLPPPHTPAPTSRKARARVPPGDTM